VRIVSGDRGRERPAAGNRLCGRGVRRFGCEALNLKCGAPAADAGGMFTATRGVPAPVRRQELRSLRVSLNTPVVAIEDLPVGPAAAAVAVHAAPGGPRLTLALRSVRTGQVVFYAPDEEWRPGDGVALDAALSFAEGLGFLFDEDALAAGGDPRDAARRWDEFVRTDAAELGGSEEILLDEPAAAPALLSKFRFAAGRGRPPGPDPRHRSGEAWIRLLCRL